MLLTACGPKLTAPNGSRVPVDTPQLRALKQQAGIEPCANGAAGAGSLPKLTIQCLGGGTSVDLATLSGPLVINIWSSTCGPCRKEMPALQAFHVAHPDVPILGIDESDTLPINALRLAKRTGVTYPLLADPGSALQETPLRAPALPTFFLVSKAGKVSRTSGGLTSQAQVEAMVEKYL